MIIYYYIFKGVKQGSTNAYKIQCMGGFKTIEEVPFCNIEDFRGHLINEEWLG